MTNTTRCIARVLILTFVNVVLAGAALAHGVTRYTNGRWFDGRQFVDGTWFAVDGTLRRSYDGPQSVTTLDLQGGYVIPPLADAHTHQLTTPDKETVERLLSQGIFYIKNPNAIARLIPQVRPLVNNPESIDMTWAAGGVTSSGGHPVQIFDPLAERLGGKMENEAYFIASSPADVDAKWAAIRGAGGDFIKAYLERAEEHEKRREDPAFHGRRGLSPATFRRLVERARADKVLVTVHATSAYDFRLALEAGADEITHLPLEKLSEADAKLAAARKTIIVTTTLSHRPTDGIDVDAVHRHNLQLLLAAGAQLVFGTDSHRSVLDEALNVQRLAGLDNATTLRMLAEATARSIFPARQIGRLAEDFEASFLVLKNDPLKGLESLRHIERRVKQGHALALRPSKPGIANEIAPIVQREGIDAAIATYRRLKRDRSGDFDFAEPQLNALGYQLLRHGKIEEAIAIFSLNVEIFPSSSNVHDSLGEAFMTAGKRDLAIASYQKALELNPHNDNARAMLEKLRKE